MDTPAEVGGGGRRKIRYNGLVVLFCVCVEGERDACPHICNELHHIV